MRGRKAEANILLLLLLFLSALWGAQEQTMRISCLNWDGFTLWPKCLPAWRKGCCNSYWDMRCSQARTSEEKRKINMTVSDTDCSHADHVSVLSICAQSAGIGHIWAVCPGCECAGALWGLLPWVWGVCLGAGCTLSTGCECVALFVAMVDGWECPVCLAGRTWEVIAKNSDNCSVQPSFWLQLLNLVWVIILHKLVNKEKYSG